MSESVAKYSTWFFLKTGLTIFCFKALGLLTFQVAEANALNGSEVLGLPKLALKIYVELLKKCKVATSSLTVKWLFTL